jgi:hypothetical protein
LFWREKKKWIGRPCHVTPCKTRLC